MLDPELVNAIFTLHQQGMPLREIARRFKISRNTVRRVIRKQGQFTRRYRRDRRQVDLELLRRLYRECNGWVQRIHEKLHEEEGISIGYSTLTRLLRDSGIAAPPPSRCDRVPDEPGLEMQHDTTIYRIPLGGTSVKLIASILYLRYSKRRYLKFYRCFNRFAMKCFLHEALMFWGFSARQCIIDNTNLARLRGTGAKAVIVPEMEAFGRQYGFTFICHAVRHPNRKAGEERSFWTTETNFLPGRTFEDLEDLNRQAFHWATERMEHRAQGKARLIPAKAFDHERQYLAQVPAHVPPPYLTHERTIDQYGYASFDANYFWVPGEERGTVKVLQYAERIKIFRNRECLAEYALPTDGVKQQRFSPPGEPQPRCQPKHQHRRADIEAKRLREMGAAVREYLDYVTAAPGVQRHRFVRGLFELSRQLTTEVFEKTVRRALRYRVTRLEVVRRIAWWYLNQHHQPLPEVDIHQDYRDREAYREGSVTELPDLSIYDSPKEPEESPSAHDEEFPEPRDENSDHG